MLHVQKSTDAESCTLLGDKLKGSFSLLRHFDHPCHTTAVTKLTSVVLNPFVLMCDIVILILSTRLTGTGSFVFWVTKVSFV